MLLASERRNGWQICMVNLTAVKHASRVTLSQGLPSTMYNDDTTSSQQA